MIARHKLFVIKSRSWLIFFFFLASGKQLGQAEEQPAAAALEGNKLSTPQGYDEQAQAATVSPAQQNPFYYADGRDEGSDGSDLRFSLMNAPHERFQAVQRLIHSQQQHPNPHQDDTHTSLPGKQDHELDLPSGMQCIHKGRHFASGQVVPIEEQPCLNCTCRRAILQCYLRICPPVISLEAKRKLLAMASGESGQTQRCRMVKEPNQCCPSLKCESVQPEPPMGNTIAIDLNSLPKGQMLSVSPLSITEPTPVLNRNPQHLMATSGQQQQMVNNRSLDLEDSSRGNNRTLSSQSPGGLMSSQEVDINSLPRLTVINGVSGQSDSILLITSNPSSNYHHSSSDRITGVGISKSSASSGQMQQQQQQQQTGDFSSALMKALLETVYSNGASRISGMNLEGSCMINGSLYVEGSAVIPEGNALCHYCYCIREKIMCIKPKCQLFISGCSPRYSNEYACCPTSYSCGSSSSSIRGAGEYLQNSGGNQLADLSLTQRSGDQLQAKGDNQQTGSILPTGSDTSGLAARLWAALDMLTRHLPMAMTHSNLPASSTSTSLYQPDRALEGAARMAQNETTTHLAISTTPEVSSTTNASAPSTTTTTTTTATSTTTTTTVRPTVIMSAETTMQPEMKSEMKTIEEEPDTPSSEQPMQEVSVGLSSTTEQAPASSVSDFLEPMTRLGPLVVSPSAPSGCLENGRSYSIGEQIPTLESCKHCYCGLEGLKECKMIECQLRVAHTGCRPVIPEGHCCPIRYECPSSMGGTSSQQSALDFRASGMASAGRYRSADDSVASVSPVFQTSSDTPQETGSQEPQSSSQLEEKGKCSTTDNAVLDDCKNNSLSVSPDDSSSSSDKPYTITETPVLETTRILVEPHQEDQLAQHQRTTINETITEELNKFIMQINGQNNNNNNNVSSHPINSNSSLEQYSSLANSPINDHSSTTTGGSTQEMMINDQHSRMLSADYHSVQAPLLPEQVASVYNSPASLELTPGIVGIPSIRVESATMVPATDSPSSSGVYTESSVEYATGSTETRQPSSSASRDSRSTRAKFSALNEMLDEHKRHIFSDMLNELAQQPPVEPVSSSLPTTIISELPAQSGPVTPTTRSSPRTGENNNGSSPVVVFDDELNAMALNNLTALPPASPQPEENPESLPATESPPTPQPVETTTTPNPSFGPTTGMPIGLDADRSPETSGWLKSLQGFVHSFGKRIAQPATNAEQASTSNLAPFNVVPTHDLQKQASGRGLTETARSSRPSLLNQLLGSVIGGDIFTPAHQVDETILHNPESRRDGERYSQISEVTSESSLEQVLAKQVPVHQGQVEFETNSSFARRSDDSANSGLDPLLPLDSSGVLTSAPNIPVHQVIHRREEKQLPRPQPPQAASLLRPLTCYDPIANRTYLPNEIMPTNRDDPCKTCTCVLGQQLCQTLVCPERPAEDCTEERRAGECCANYLCGNHLNQQRQQPQVAPIVNAPQTMIQPASSPVLLDDKAKQPPNTFTGPNLGFREGTRLPIGQLLALQRQPAHSNQPIHNQSTNFNFNRLPPVQDQRSRQALSYPTTIRTSNIAALLPQHLRFRPNLQMNPMAAAALENQPAQLFNIDQSRVIFNSILQGQQNLNHQQKQQQSLGATNWHLNPTINAMQQVNSRPFQQAPSFDQFSNPQNRFNTANLKPPMLMHPPRSPTNLLSQPNWQQISTAQRTNNNEGVNQPQVIMQPAHILLSRTGTTGQAPQPLQKLNSISSTQVSPSETASSSQVQASFEAPKSMVNSVNFPSEISNELLPSEPVSPTKERILFPNQSGEFGGFRPIPSPVLRPTDNLPSLTIITSTTASQPDILRVSTSSSTTTTTEIPETTTTQAPQIEPQRPTEVPFRLTSETFDSEVKIPKLDVESTSLINSPVTVATTTTAATTTTTQQDSSTMLPSTSSQQEDTHLLVGNSSESPTEDRTTTTQTEGTQEFDPLAMFKVSECNIYGRLYKVGQVIDELSDVCKRCTCSQMGVDCQTTCS